MNCVKIGDCWGAIEITEELSEFIINYVKRLTIYKVDDCEHTNLTEVFRGKINIHMDMTSI